MARWISALAEAATRNSRRSLLSSLLSSRAGVLRREVAGMGAFSLLINVRQIAVHFKGRSAQYLRGQENGRGRFLHAVQLPDAIDQLVQRRDIFRFDDRDQII